MRNGIAILGSTGSIGCNTLRVIDALDEQFRVVALGAGRNILKLADQIEKYHPELVSVDTEDCAIKLKELLLQRNVSVPYISIGQRGLIDVATHDDAHCVVSAAVGAVGLVPTLCALELGKRVALANKETLVMAGELMTKAAQKSGAELLPVDSEHNALHQCLRGETRSEVRRLILTASGGPFRNKDYQAMKEATVAEAMRHPTWNMGSKITIDSATLMNKGLEVIEAHWLFGFESDSISILIHPESVVHSMIELIDGSIIAQLGITDMRHAIQYALTYPKRFPSNLPPLNLTQLATLNFEAPDEKRFPCLRLAYQALREGGTLPAAMNAANEEAVKAFIDERIHLTDIPTIIERVMEHHQKIPASSLDIVIEVDKIARTQTNELVQNFSSK
jgi:1-deoxy-D-xylulose-5-phosphate reductoisomerase